MSNAASALKLKTDAMIGGEFDLEDEMAEIASDDEPSSVIDMEESQGIRC
jgi:hypothetical protein